MLQPVWSNKSMAGEVEEKALLCLIFIVRADGCVYDIKVDLSIVLAYLSWH